MRISSRQAFEVALASRLDEDPAFRDRLLTDPPGAITDLVGTRLPDAVKVSVHEESVTDIHIVLGPSSDELTDGDLELVAGGTWGFSSGGACGDSCGSCIP